MNCKRLLMLLAALLLLSGAACAATLEAPMTEAEMEAIWQISLEKMNAEGTVNQSGELPGAGMIDYETALALARQAIFDKYGTPEEELDAMGVYPDWYMDTWHIWFNPVRDQDIHLDVAYYAAPGQYRVYLDGKTGEVTFINWYMDEFWDVAQRVWDAGKHDVVYDRANGPAFFYQSQENQQHFLTLLAEAGYDVAALEKTPEQILLRRSLDVLFADPATVVQPEDDPLVAKAWKAVERLSGVDADILRQYAYVATYSPAQLGTTDIVIAYNYETEFLWQEDDLTDWDCRLFSNAKRLGMFLVQIDKESSSVVNTIRVYDRDDEPIMDSLLGRQQWTGEDFMAFHRIFTDFHQEMEAAVKDGESYEAQEALYYRYSRSMGGDVGPYHATEIAQHAAAAHLKITTEAFIAQYPESEAYFGRNNEYEVCLWGESGPVWRVIVNGMTEDVVEISRDEEGVG